MLQRVVDKGREKAIALKPHAQLIGHDALAFGFMARDSILMALAATTAIAAGFLAALGLDSMVLIGKWTVISAVVFYAGMLWALLSPLTVVAQVLRSIESKARNDAQRRRFKEASEDQTKRNELQQELAGAEKAFEQAKSRKPKRFRTQESLDSEAEALRKLQTVRGKLESISEMAPPSQEEERRKTWMVLLQGVSWLIYALAICVLVYWTVGLNYAWKTLAAVALVLVLSRRTGAVAVLPLLTVVLLFYG